MEATGDLRGRRQAIATEVKPIFSAPSPIYPHRGHLEIGGPDVSLRSNSLQRTVHVLAKLDDCVEGHVLTPLGRQPLNHLRKPYLVVLPHSKQRLHLHRKRLLKYQPSKLT